jgi:2-phosphosulfolactate phosphatase
MVPAHRQSAFSVRLDWGLEGADAILPGADVAIIVDVLSFTTTVTVAVEAGIRVWPYRWDDESARTFATRHRAVLAVGRARARPGQISLSPVTISATHGVARLVLPSPNGSTIAARLAGGEAGSPGSASQVRVFAASLRNAAALARHIAGLTGVVSGGSRLSRTGAPVVAIIAAGEHWPGGGLRPAIEDLWGAGAVIAGLQDLGRAGISPEAQSAADAYRGVLRTLPQALLTCASGQELTDQGYRGDVEIAAAVGASEVVPQLDDDGAFRPG